MAVTKQKAGTSLCNQWLVKWGYLNQKTHSENVYYTYPVVTASNNRGVITYTASSMLCGHALLRTPTALSIKCSISFRMRSHYSCLCLAVGKILIFACTLHSPLSCIEDYLLKVSYLRHIGGCTIYTIHCIFQAYFIAYLCPASDLFRENESFHNARGFSIRYFLLL